MDVLWYVVCCFVWNNKYINPEFVLTI
jgi:hypothetical protein